MNIYFVRHGETARNRERRLQGRSDEPLSEEGVRQAQAVRDLMQNVSFDAVYSSPLRRAVQTAEIITGKQELILKDALLEMDYGPYEGTDLQSLPPELAHFFRDFVRHPAPEGMESLAQVKERLLGFLTEVKEMRADHVLVVTHAIALKAALEVLMPESQGGWWSRYISTCAVFRTTLENGIYSQPEEIFSLPVRPGV